MHFVQANSLSSTIVDWLEQLEQRQKQLFPAGCKSSSFNAHRQTTKLIVTMVTENNKEVDVDYQSEREVTGMTVNMTESDSVMRSYT